MSENNPLATLNPSIVGRAEKAHTAVLKEVLTDTTLDESQWITLQLALGSAEQLDRASLIDRVTSAAKYDPATVDSAVAALGAASLLEWRGDDPNSLVVTVKGHDLVAALRTKIAQRVRAAYGSIPAEDLATAARVLTSVTAKLSESLASS